MKELEDVLKKDPECKGLVKHLRDAKDKKWLPQCFGTDCDTIVGTTVWMPMARKGLNSFI